MTAIANICMLIIRNSMDDNLWRVREDSLVLGWVLLWPLLVRRLV